MISTAFAPLVAVLLCVALLGSAQAAADSASIVQIRAVAADGNVTLGSGVIVDRERIATACHCLRGASTIEIVRGDARWHAASSTGSEHHDVCLLVAHGLDGPSARVRSSADLKRGERVVAVGFRGGDSLVVEHGEVAELYPYDDASVIRTTAAFDFGSSGGGLFDGAGRLVGVLGFKARRGDLRFALPIDWLIGGKVASSLAAIGSAPAVRAFWEQPRSDRPAFLGAALQEAASK